MQNKNSVLFIGRFQPFHMGHFNSILHLSKKYGKIKIIIGSSEEKLTFENPFSFSERKQMIKSSFSNNKSISKKLSFAGLPDFPSNKKWSARVKARFSRKKYQIYSANPLVRKLLFSAGYQICPSPLYKRSLWQGKKIRKKIREGKKFEKEIPVKIRKWMKEKGEKIIRALS